MLLFIAAVLFSFGSDIDELISDSNIKFNSTDKTFVVEGNIINYNVTKDPSIVSAKDGSAYYQYSVGSAGGEALYKKVKNLDGTFTTSRYKVDSEVVRSITECKTVTIPGYIYNTTENRCIYLDYEACNNLNNKEIKLLEEGTRSKIDGLVRLDVVFTEGDAKTGKNYRSRQATKAQAAQRKISEIFKGDTIDLLRRGVEPSEVNMMVRKIKNSCEQLTGAKSFFNVPPKAPAAQ
ncbi:MAG: hypothetical protein KDD37_02895 [Bdellovibrionales bacterium]|nr:hypothetical protein [Bdellovibrionales bacterium]